MSAVLHNAWLIPALPLLAFALTGLFLQKRPQLAAFVSIGAIAVSFLMSVRIAWGVFTGPPEAVFQVARRWLEMPGLKVDMGILIDPLAALMLIVVTSVALLVQIYSLGYMHGDSGFARYFSYQSAFAASMLGLVLANNFGQIFVFWELVGLCSYLLIGFWYGRQSAADAAKKAFITNRVGDFGFLLGILFLAIMFGTLDFSELAARIQVYDRMLLLVPVAILLFFGPVGKSAQFPLHVWLPDAMEGPTPVSALIHAATMVAAGVYLVARAYFIFNAVPEAMTIIAYTGGFTALFAASIALVQNDIKRILAYSTLSQLGYMMMALGVGAMTAGMFHLMTHAFFKSLLFLGAGSVIHALHDEQDIWKMGGLARKMPVTAATFIIGALALAGIPPLSGFWSKDEILLGTYAGGYTGLYALGSVVAFMTAFYMFRLVFVTFFGKVQAEMSGHTSWVMEGPLVVLAIMAVIAGFAGSPLMDYAISHYITYPGAPHHAPSAAIMIISSLLGVAGIALAWAIYQREWISHAALRQRWPRAYEVLYNKYYIDEFYQYLIDRWVDGTGRIMEWIDLELVNGGINGLAGMTKGSGDVLRRTEDGQVQNYARFMFAGVLFILLAALFAAFQVQV